MLRVARVTIRAQLDGPVALEEHFDKVVHGVMARVDAGDGVRLVVYSSGRMLGFSSNYGAGLRAMRDLAISLGRRIKGRAALLSAVCHSQGAPLDMDVLARSSGREAGRDRTCVKLKRGKLWVVAFATGAVGVGGTASIADARAAVRECVPEAARIY